MTELGRVLEQQLSYSAWASARLLSFAAELSGDDLRRDFKTSESSVLGTLVHVFAADRVWLRRLQSSTAVAPFHSPRDFDLAILREEWPPIGKALLGYVDGASEEALQSPCFYFDYKNQQWSMPPWQILLHVVNHGTHHRGQISGFLRTMGHPPPPLDLIVFLRQQTNG